MHKKKFLAAGLCLFFLSFLFFNFKNLPEAQASFTWSFFDIFKKNKSTKKEVIEKNSDESSDEEEIPKEKNIEKIETPIEKTETKKIDFIPKVSTILEGAKLKDEEKTLLLTFPQKMDTSNLLEYLKIQKLDPKSLEVLEDVNINVNTEDRIVYKITPNNEKSQWEINFSYQVFLPTEFFGKIGDTTQKNFVSTFIHGVKPEKEFYLQDMAWKDNLSDLKNFDSDHGTERFELTFSENFSENANPKNFFIEPQPKKHEIKIEKNKILIFGDFDQSKNYILDLNALQDRFGRALHFSLINLPKIEIKETETRFFKKNKIETFFYTKDNLPEFVFKKGKDVKEKKEIKLTLCRINQEEENIFSKTPFYFNTIEKLIQNDWQFNNKKKELEEKEIFKSEISESDCTEKITKNINLEAVRVLKIELKDWLTEFEKNFGIFAFYIEDDQSINHSIRYFGVLNASILMKQGDNSIMAWAFDLENKNVIENSEIWIKNIEKYESKKDMDLPKSPSQIFDKKDGYKILGVTNEDGVVKKIADKEFKNKYDVSLLIQDENYFGFVIHRWSDGLNSYNFPIKNELSYDERSLANKKILGHVYTEKLLYRPGQKVNFKGIFRERNKKNGIIDFPEIEKVQLRITNSRGKEIKNQDLELNKYGSVSDNFVLPQNAPLGSYTILLTPYTKNLYAASDSPEEEKFRPDHSANISTNISVEEYALPKFKFSVDTKKYDYFANEKINLQVRAQEYTGNPIVGGKISYRLIARPFYPEDKQDSGFIYESLGNFSKAYRNITILSDDKLIEKNGIINLEIPLDSSEFEKDFDYSLSLELTVFDDQNREVSDTVSFRRLRVFDEDDYVPGIKIEKKVFLIDEDFIFDYVTKNARMERLHSKKLQLKISEKIQKCKKQEAAHKGEINHCEIVTEEIFAEELTTNKNGLGTFSHKFEKPGKYKIELANGEHKVEQEIRIVSESMTPAVDNQEDRYLELLLDKETYAEDEKAKIFLHSPYEKSLVLLTFEANEVVQSEVIEMETSMLEYEIDVSGKFVPNIYVSAIAIEKNNSSLPEFKIGYVNMAVETDSKNLQINIKSNKNTYKPGEEVTLNIETKNKNGAPVSAEISIAAVDEAIIRLGGQVDTRLKRIFYSRKLLFVKNAFSLVGLHSDPIFATYGGAGKGGLSYDTPPVRKNFEEVAYWNAFVETDKDGKATIKFKVPDKLTSYIILGAGFSLQNQLFGSSEVNFSVQKDFFVEPILPRFFRKNDTAVINARVYNRTKKEAEVGVKFEFAGGEILDESEKKQKIGAGETKDFLYKIKIHDNKEKAILTFKTISNTGSDAMQMTLPIKGYSLFSSLIDSVSINQEKYKFLTQLSPYISHEKGEINLEISSSVLGSLKNQVKKMLRYPYGCAEQTTSSTVPNAIYYMLQKDLEINDDQAKKNTLAGIERLKKFQKPDGGFNLWEHDSDSSVRVSQTVGKGLALIAKAGFEIPEEMKNNFVAYLNNVIENKISAGNSRYGKQQKLSDRDRLTLVYIASILNPQKNLLGQVDMAFYKFPELGLQEKAMLAEIYISRLPHSSGKDKEILDKKLAIIKDYLWNSIKKEDENFVIQEDFKLQYEGIYHFYQDKNTALAEIFSVLVKLDPNNSKIKPLIVQIQKPRKNQHGFFSSFEERIRFLALANYFQYAQKNNENEGINFVLNIGDEEYPINLNELKVEKLNIPLPKVINPDSGIEIQTYIKDFDKENIVFLNYDIKYFVDDITKMAPTENNLLVYRKIKYHDETPVENFDNTKVGDIYWVTLHVDNPKIKNQIAITDHLPANAEFIDPPKNVPEFEYLDFRDDRLDAFLKPKIQNAMVNYKIRIISAGSFHWPPPQGTAMYEPSINGSGQGRLLEMK